MLHGSHKGKLIGLSQSIWVPVFPLKKLPLRVSRVTVTKCKNSFGLWAVLCQQCRNSAIRKPDLINRTECLLATRLSLSHRRRCQPPKRPDVKGHAEQERRTQWGNSQEDTVYHVRMPIWPWVDFCSHFFLSSLSPSRSVPIRLPPYSCFWGCSRSIFPD